MQTTDEQTRSTLRTLKQNGVLRARDANGDPLELDPAIASDLLNGEKLSLAPPTNAALVVPNSLDARKQAPLPGLGQRDDVPSKRNSISHAPTNASCDELMTRLASDCEAFNHNLVANFNTAKETMQKSVLELFKTTSKDKLPDSFLRSLPKWGKGATKLHQVFNKSINRKATDTAIDQKEVPFELVIQPEILQEMDKDIHSLIDDELKRCVGENGIVIKDMQKILMQVTVMVERLRQFEDKLAREETELRALQDRLHDERLLTKELTQTIEILTSEAREKELQMDILRDQVQRERDMSKQKRAEFFKEICRYKTQIFQHSADEERERDRDRDRERPKSPRTRERKDSGSAFDMRSSENDASYSLGTDQAEMQMILEQKEQEWRSEHHEQVRALKIQHADQVRQLQQQKKIACDERDDKNTTLAARVKKLEMELVEEKRKLRRFLSIKDQQQ